MGPDVVEDHGRLLNAAAREGAPAFSGIADALALLLIVAAGVFVYINTPADHIGDTATSRLATVYGLVHHGTWRIDEPENPFESATVDKCMIDGGLYSTKPPLLPMIMAGEYWLLHRYFGADLTRKEGTRLAVEIVTLTLVATAYVSALIYFLLLARWLIPNPWGRLAALFSLAFGTQLLGFATHIDNHLPAAGVLMPALYLAVGLATERLRPVAWRFALFGVLGGLVFALDMPITAFVAAAGLWLLWRFPKQTALWGGVGMLAPLGIHFTTMVAVTGSPLPVQTRLDLYLYESSYWRNPSGVDALNEPKLTYFFHMNFGRFGSFTLFPVLLTGLAGAVWCLFRERAPVRGMVLGAAAAFALMTCYYVFNTNNYGGAAYGFRWHIAAMPVLLLMGAPVWNGLRRPWQWALFVALVAVSCYSCWECFRTPWGEHQEWTCRVFGTSY